ncbi:MAG: 3-hydroxyacyl-CoA dehydrogenase PaaC [Gammaproteobacteria bacterium]|nr:3-hydroxyacyl-CoA dehydrogenase PaaC [Gammaproteobacteria bacterium]MCP5425675.1 3-hydroxyacyl-CoA dehydrogenase PaaC [Gammaproteobacteria bacterium]MCP5459706.1 3-hydroxyacyl-CoA dehydrogenase PaaC [Gammaproteobacteria bacterium]
MAALPSSAKIGIIGAGTMGAGIAQVAARAGYQVLLFDAMVGAVEKGLQRITQDLERLVKRGKLTSPERDVILWRISPVHSLEALAPAKLVLEAIVEDLEVKRNLFAQIETICGDEVIPATNTSSLSITAIGAKLKRPQNLVGMHFFNPAPVMKLVEVVSGIDTDPGIAATIYDTAQAWGKIAVHVKSTPGFIVNRVARPFYAEGMRVLQEGGADAATLDAILRESGGFPMGPFELMDLIGHDVNFAVTGSVFTAYFNDQRFQPSLLQQELVSAGYLGRKTGRGFHFYEHEDGRSPTLPATTEPGPRPGAVTVHGHLGVAEPLVDRLSQAGITVTRADGDGYLQVAGTRLYLSDGRLATERAAATGCANLALFDLALDYVKAGRIALTTADQAAPETAAIAAGLFQALGKTVSVIDDIPGLMVMRTVCMLANEGADAVNQGVCTAEAVDLGMRNGVNYPRGPLAWAEAIGLPTVLSVLDNLARTYGEDRYRASPLLRRKVFGGSTFHG